jgi:hypothetical protein
LADGKISQSVSPLSCSGEGCNAYFIPGPLSNILFDPSVPNLNVTDYPTATSFIQFDAPGYQIEYCPIDPKDPAFTLDDCRVHGGGTLAVNICMKNVNSSLLAGISYLV